MTSWQQIANMALFELGSQPLVNYDTQDDVPAQLCRTFMQQAVNEVLVERFWSCAKARQSLALLEEKPEGDVWQYQFQLPVSPRCLQIRGTDPETSWEREGKRIFTNLNAITLLFTKEITDPTELDDYMLRPIALHLAQLIGFKLNSDKDLPAKLLAFYKLALEDAKAADAIGAKHEIKDESKTDWTEVG